MAGREVPGIVPVIDAERIKELRQAVAAVFIDEKIKTYILNIVFASRQPERFGLDLAPLIAYGASPRATLALTQLARARALPSDAKTHYRLDEWMRESLDTATYAALVGNPH